MHVAGRGAHAPLSEPVRDFRERPAFAAQFANRGPVCFQLAAARFGGRGLRLRQ